jgi:hypothetical protein
VPEEENGQNQARDDSFNERDHSLDELAKGLANGSLSRRDALKWAGAALVGGLLGSIPGAAWANHRPGHADPPGKGHNPRRTTTSTTTTVAPTTTTSTTTTPPPHTCFHDPCVTGDPLTPGCDAAGCVAQVCDATPFCCGNDIFGIGHWQSFCAAAYAQCCPSCCPPVE